jgi:hypothetical protein
MRVFNRIKRLFRKGPETNQEALAERWNAEKSELMEHILGTEHDMVLHAMIPYGVGGGLDLFYYPNLREGVGIATKELSPIPRQGSSNASYECFELVMFTRHELNMSDTHNPETPFGRAHMKIQRILNHIGPYSAQATLNPYETSEFPAEMEHLGGTCMIFVPFGPASPFGILGIIEIFRSEMIYAREHGGQHLIQLLTDAGHFPYSDLERDAVA